jgi:hypothetical protein
MRVRESIVAAVALGAFGQVGDFDPGQPPTASGSGGGGASAPPAGSPVELPTGVFRGKGLADSVRLYLSLAKRKQTFKEIKAALMEGGLATTSAFFDQTLNATLHRMKKSGEVLQFKDGWDLAESYPDGFRQRHEASKDDAPRKKRKKKVSRSAKPQGKGSKVPKDVAHPEPALRAV